MKPLIYSFFLLPIIGCLCGFQWKMNQLIHLKQTINLLEIQALEVASWQQKNQSCLDELHQTDRSYLEKHLESFVLLEPEIRRLQATLQHQKEKLILSKRLEFLKNGNNRICFAEEKRRSSDAFQEVEEKLDHSVEMNEEDLKKLLALIEGVSIPPYHPLPGKPQLIFREFNMTKQLTFSEEEVYVIDFKLLKREPL